MLNYRKPNLCKKGQRAVNNSLFKAHSDPFFPRLDLHDTYKLGVLSFMHKYFYENLPTSFHDMFNSLAEPNKKNINLNGFSLKRLNVSKIMELD